MTDDTLLILAEQLQGLVDGLYDRGYQTLGPRLERGAIVYGPVSMLSEFPRGFLDHQDGGHYRLARADSASPESRSLFRYVVGPQSWKRYLFPPWQSLWHVRRTGLDFALDPEVSEPPRYAFIGVRACELAAMAIQDRVFDNGDHVDPEYCARRARAFVIAVNCTRAGGTCFCTSMQTGPRAGEGFDLCLTELLDEHGHRFLVDVGTESGRALMAQIPHRVAGAEEIAQGEAAVADAAARMGRTMSAEAAAVLARNPQHPRWEQVASRCLGCANCTMVCPTCFCSKVEDVISLDGREAERRRQWDSCFNLEFSYVHGGPVRREAAARYRHWITHKLSTWHAQFGTSGCTGCGRCITWCPVGIDMTEEVAAIAATECNDLRGEA